MKLEAGTVCIKTVGRDAGKRCVVVSSKGNEIEIISEIRRKRRKCNIRHLKPTSKKISTDEAEIFKEFGVKPPKPSESKAPKPQKAEMKTEKKNEQKEKKVPLEEEELPQRDSVVR